MTHFIHNPSSKPRLFFALWPDQQVRDAMVVEKNKVLAPGQMVKPMNNNNLHMTLHFIGTTTLQHLECMDEQAAQIKTPAFKLSLDDFGHFKKARILWLGCSQSPVELFQLHQQLAERLNVCDYDEEDRPYAPHVSLFRKARDFSPSEKPEPIVWAVNSFSLIESVIGHESVTYRELRRYALC